MCCLYAPSVFEIDDETRSVVKQQGVAPLAEVQTAVEACPTGALTLVVEPGA
jgi:ferredoxin